MRLLRISTPYPDYLRRFYAKRPWLASKPYAAQYRELMADSFQQLDSYSFYLKALGYECEEVIANALPLLRAWRKENGVRDYSEDQDWFTCLEMAERFQPDVVLLANARRFSRVWVDLLRNVCPKVRCVLGWWGVDILEPRQISGFNVVLTCNRELARTMRQMGATVEVLPFAFDPRILAKLDCGKKPSISVSFLGSVRRTDAFHRRRARLLERISEKVSLRIHTQDGSRSPITLAGARIAYGLCGLLRQVHLGERVLKRLPVLGRAARWKVCPRLDCSHRLWRRVQPPLYGHQYYQALRDSSISLNIHPECAGNSASNIRLFEATGVGTCLLTDWKSDLAEYFQPEREVVSFKCEEECVEKIEWLLDHESERASISEAGQIRTLRTHHFSGLAHNLHQIITRHL